LGLLPLVRVRTALALGLPNIARVASYRMRVRAGIHPVQRLPATAPPRGPFFGPARTPCALPAPSAWLDAADHFGWYRTPLGDGPPDWHRNPFLGTRAHGYDRPWWRLPDFDPAAGDVKAIWEASRLDWALNDAQRGRTGHPGALERLNAWLADWCAKNPPFRGHNWKCGQEASIRVMHLALAALVLEQARTPLPALVELVTLHLRRIAPTLAYAVGQDNNHGTSEAAALFIGGSWLEMLGGDEGRSWHRLGRERLEERTLRLVADDGSFSQYSTSYHRLALDALSLAEVWRRRCGLVPWSAAFVARAAAAADWLRATVDPDTGDAPNIGANDGADLLPLTDADRRDFRPSVQLATALFAGRSAYGGVGRWQAQLAWLGVAAPEEAAPAVASRLCGDGGYVILRRGGATAVLRFPRYRFRPGHADALHVDLWAGGENLLRDGGSFSYAGDPEWSAYFMGAAGHNGVQFDDREQMPRLGRFLWGGWLRTDALEAIQEGGESTTAGAAYADAEGARHHRRIALRDGRLVVTDTLSGFRRRAVLRWRLRPAAWTVRGHEATDGVHRLVVSADVPIARCALTAGHESRYYLQRTEVPVLEVEVRSAGRVTTEYRWTR